MNRTGALDAELVDRVRQGRLGEQRLRRQIAIRRHLVGNQLILSFYRQIDPGLRGMNVEVPASEAVAAVRRNLAPVRKNAVLDIVDMKRARVFRLGSIRIVAARDDQHSLVGGSCHDLMEIDAGFELV